VQDVEERPRTFFPSHINAYRQCPQRFYLQYIRKLKRPRPFSAALVKGGATHRLIAQHLPRFLRSGELPTDLRGQARLAVEAGNYPASELSQLERDALEVADWTVRALEMLPPGARPLFVERKLYSPVGRHGLQLGAQVDLVLQHDDQTVEHIDFKTGKLKHDPVQMLVSRIVVGKRMSQAPRITTTTLNVQHRHIETAEMDRERCAGDWGEIASTLRAVRSTDEWIVLPGPLCDYCQFKARDCPAW
jgi:hypothetical protein